MIDMHTHILPRIDDGAKDSTMPISCLINTFQPVDQHLLAA